MKKGENNNLIEIFVLTHKEIKEQYDKKLYIPLFCGSSLKEETFGYTTDNSGENISNLNSYYAELTGQYWAYKNSKADIIGFCHYRRWFLNIYLKKLNYWNINLMLNQFNIILPQKTKLKHSVIETIENGLERNPEYGAKVEEYIKLKKVIKNNFPSYYDTYNDILEGNECYNNNMFICQKELANEYFDWLFSILKIMFKKIDFSKYAENNKRVLGFLSEILLTTFIKHHNFSVRECLLYLPEEKHPFLFIINRKFHLWENFYFR